MVSYSLQSLPAELVQAICSNFCQHCTLPLPPEESTMMSPYHIRGKSDTLALANLSKTCRKLHRVANPILYHDYTSTTRKMGQNCQFLRTVITNPELAANVHRLVVDSECLHNSSPPMSKEDWSLAKWVVHSDTPMSNPDKPGRFWLDAHTRKQSQSSKNWAVGKLFHMVLHRLPNIEYLYLEADIFVEYGAFFSSSGNLPLVTGLHLNWLNMPCGISDPFKNSGIGRFAWLIEQMPNLQSLTLEHFPFNKCELALGNLRRIELKDCYLYRAGLDVLTSQCPQLEAFTFNLQPRKGLMLLHSDHFSHPQRIIRALRSCKATLLHLEIQCVQHWDRDDPIAMITSLKEFQVLETVVLDVECLSNFHRLQAYPHNSGDPNSQTSSLVGLLPASIRSVVIDGYAPTLFGPTLELVSETDKGAFPRLREFTYLDIFQKLAPENIDTLNERMKSVGVSFLVSEDSKFYFPTVFPEYWIRR